MYTIWAPSGKWPRPYRCYYKAVSPIGSTAKRFTLPETERAQEPGGRTTPTKSAVRRLRDERPVPATAAYYHCAVDADVDATVLGSLITRAPWRCPRLAAAVLVQTLLKEQTNWRRTVGPSAVQSGFAREDRRSVSEIVPARRRACREHLEQDSNEATRLCAVDRTAPRLLGTQYAAVPTITPARVPIAVRVGDSVD